MSGEGQIQVQSPAKKAPKKKTTAKKSVDHPKYIDMVKSAITCLKERNGSSRQAILKYINGNFKVTDTANVHVKLALKRGVTSGDLLQVKGTGASGSFKVKKKEVVKPKKPAAPKKKPTKKPAAKKPAAKKATKKAPKKPTTPKKTTKKKPAKKTSAKKAPTKKVGKKPAAKKIKKTPKKGGKKK